MKYKVGDKVRIKSKEILKNTPNTVSDMLEYAGKEAFISRVIGDNSYEIDADNSEWSWTDDMFEEPTLFDRIKSAIIEAGKQAPIIIEQTDDGGIKISPINEDYLPIDTPCVVSTKIGLEVGDWAIRHYAGRNTCFIMGTNSANRENPKTQKWDYIIPFDRFDLNNIEESLKYNIVK